MALTTPIHGVRELSLRGAPLARVDWLGRHDGHDVRVVALPDVSLRVVDEEAEVEEVTTDYDDKGKAYQKKTGVLVMQKTGKKREVRGDAPSDMDLLLCVTCGLIGFDHEPPLATPPITRPPFDPPFDPPITPPVAPPALVDDAISSSKKGNR